MSPLPVQPQRAGKYQRSSFYCWFVVQHQHECVTVGSFCFSTLASDLMKLCGESRQRNKVLTPEEKENIVSKSFSNKSRGLGVMS